MWTKCFSNRGNNAVQGLKCRLLLLADCTDCTSPLVSYYAKYGFKHSQTLLRWLKLLVIALINNIAKFWADEYLMPVGSYLQQVENQAISGYFST